MKSKGVNSDTNANTYLLKLRRLHVLDIDLLDQFRLIIQNLKHSKVDSFGR